MKSLLIITTRFNHPNDPFAATFIFDQVEELRKKFEKVIVISIRPYTPKFLKPFIAPKRFRDSLVSDYKYDNVKVFYTKDFIIPFGILKKIWSKLALQKARKILKRLNFSPSVIHAHRTWPSAYVAMKLSKEFNTKYFVTAHGYDAYGLYKEGRYWEKHLSRVLSNANKIIAVSSINKDILVNNLHINKNKVVIIPNGFDNTKFYPINKIKCRQELNLSLDKKIFVSVGFLEKVKGYNFLIEAIAKFKMGNYINNISFIIIGDGNERQSLMKFANEKGVSEIIKFVGSKNHSEINIWINSCDIFLMSSLNEGVPTVLFEALACGKPFVGTKVGGIPDIVSDSRIGLLVPPADSEELFRAIKKSLSLNWDNRFIEEYSRKFSWENIANSIYDIYRL